MVKKGSNIYAGTSVEERAIKKGSNIYAET